VIYDGMFLTRSLKNQKGNSEETASVKFKMVTFESSERRKQMDINRQKFWEKHPHCNYSHSEISWNRVPNISEIPNEYVPFMILHKDDDKNFTQYYLYCKKVANKYHYLLDLNGQYRDYNEDDYHYYDPEFVEKLVSFLMLQKMISRNMKSTIVYWETCIQENITTLR
jgi:hypothetical protein